MFYLFEDCAFDAGRRELRRGGEPVAIEPKIFDLLAFLIENRDRVVTKDDLREAVWEGRYVSESALNTAINAARSAIGDNGEEQRLIRTLPRKGLRFVGSVRLESASSVTSVPEGSASAAPAAAAGSSTGDLVPAASEQRPGYLIEPAAAVPPAARPPRAVTVTRTALVISLAAAALIAATLVYVLWPASPPLVSPSVALSGPKFDASSVPLISDASRKSLATYPSRADHKALAITVGGWGVAEGEANAEAAKQDALRRCVERAKRQCKIYAVGMEVVWPKDALPLPAPEDLRFEPLDVPLIPAEIPTLALDRTDFIARNYMRASDHRALAITTGAHLGVNSIGTRAEAARLAIERCVETWQRPCLLLAMDGRLTIQIPKTRQVIRIFLPSGEAEIPADDRKRIVQIYQGAEWRALVRGQNGWHAVAGAPSEAAAIEAALKSCAWADTDCRLYAIGNFRVAEQ